MDELIKTFHIEANLLLAQMINFIIVLLVLYKFAYKPVLKMLNDRTGKIERGLHDAEEMRGKLEGAAQKEKEIIMEAKKEAQEIIRKAEMATENNKKTAILETKKESEKILDDARKQIENEKSRIMKEIKSEISELIIGAAGKIISEKISGEKDSELISRAMREIR